MNGVWRLNNYDVSMMSANPERTPAESSSSRQATSTKKQNASLTQRIEILDWHHQSSSKNQTKTAAHWDKIYPTLQIKQPTISAWLKEENKWRAQWAEAQSRGHDGRSTKRRKQVEFPDVGEMVELWVSKAVVDGVDVGGESLRRMWGVFADLEGVTEEERPWLGTAWVEGMKKRCGLAGYKRSGEAVGVAPAGDAEKERARIRAVIAQFNYALKDIFNMDETGLFYAMPPDRSLGNGDMLTYALTVNADGSEKLPPVVIGKAVRPRAFQKKTGTELGFHYRNNAMTWMTIKLYQEWLSDWEQKLQKEGRHVLLLQDNLGVHIPPEKLTNIRVETFMLDGTTDIQPNEAGIARSFKARYRAKFINQAIDRHDTGTPKEQIYDIDQLEAMRLGSAAWEETDAETVRNCWRKTGILPDLAFGTSPSVSTGAPVNQDRVSVMRDAEKVLSSALNQLESRGLLQSGNRLTREELLSLSSEQDPMKRIVADREIYNAVKDMRRGEQMREINGGDDGVYTIPENKPTRQEALSAVLTLQRYLMNINEPFARELEAELANFGKQSRREEPRHMGPASTSTTHR